MNREKMEREKMEYLQSRGVINASMQINKEVLQKEGLKEAAVFVGALARQKDGINKIPIITLYLQELNKKKHYESMHMYVQQCYSAASGHEELDGFYTASLSKETLQFYASWFLRCLVPLATTITALETNIYMKEMASPVIVVSC